jgi:glycosyltransferase involved in cell wall biosynthesis
MKTSLIVTTYNWKEALDLTLRSVARQVEMPDEVIVADDGSRPDTAELVRAWAERLPMPLLHVWQEDLGFRLSRSRNRAIAAAGGDYIVMVDGDLVLDAHFIADHKRAARRGCFIQGARLLTSAATGRRMLAEGILDLGFFARGIERRRHAIRNRVLSWLVYQVVHTDQKALRGCNQAYWKDDLLRVNGFDERMVGWGREDNEIAARLYNIGVKRRNLKFSGLAIHIHHHTRKRSGDSRNRALLARTIEEGIRWCSTGIDRHLGELSRKL